MRDDGNDPNDSPELDDRERAVLDAWSAAEPPPGFADRVVAAAHAAPAPPAPAERPRSGRPVMTVAAVVTAACAGAIVIALVRGTGAPAAPASGAIVAAHRDSLTLGRRGVAVVEPGAVLAWTVDGAGVARVQQDAGAVFYRVERGGPFVVVTPSGEVRVTGTCFAVEVPMKPVPRTLLTGAIGAAVAAAVVVTVYEGGVVVAGPHGTTPVAAGERVTLGADGRIAIAAAARAEVAPPPTDATREQLLTRDQVQRQRIASLEAKVGELEQRAGAGGPRRRGGPGEMDDDGHPWFDPSPEALATMAKECRIRIDAPPVFDSEPPEPFDPRDADEIGVEAGDVEGINAALREIHARWSEKVRAIYVEVTGNAAGADELSPHAMAQEIMDKSPRGESNRIRGRIANERAGLARPPTDLSKASPLERYLRAWAALGDDTEAALARRIGADKARQLREADGLFGMHSEMGGCAHDPDEDGEAKKRK